MSDPTLTRRCVCRDCGRDFYDGGRGRRNLTCPDCKVPRCRACRGVVPMTQRGGPRGGLVRSGYYCSDECKPRCSIDSCTRPERKRGWCSNHYAAWRAHGDPEAPAKTRWSADRLCVVCGASGDSPWWEQGRRKWCSARCLQLWRTHKGNVPEFIICATCGIRVPLNVPVGDRSRRRSDTAFCDQHARHARSTITAAEIAAEDGAWCRLCGEDVDLSVASPDRRAPSVDHIVPRALGGSDDRSNLQLAHRGCNSSKRHRYVG